VLESFIHDRQTWETECGRGWQRPRQPRFGWEICALEVWDHGRESYRKWVRNRVLVQLHGLAKKLWGLNRSEDSMLCWCSEGQTDWAVLSSVPNWVSWLRRLKYDTWEPITNLPGSENIFFEFHSNWKENHKIKSAAAVQSVIDKRNTSHKKKSEHDKDGEGEGGQRSQLQKQRQTRSFYFTTQQKQWQDRINLPLNSNGWIYIFWWPHARGIKRLIQRSLSPNCVVLYQCY
jgi:hypothetical protein